MNDFSKKWTTIVGGLALSAVLVGMIFGQHDTDPQEDITQNGTANTPSDLVVTWPEGNPNPEGSNLQIPSIGGENTPEVSETPSGNQETITHPDETVKVPAKDSMNGNDQGTEQTIQPDVPAKPTYTEEQLSDPTQTPSGGAVTQTENGSVPVETPEPSPPTVTVQPETTPAPEVIPDSQITGQEGEGKYVEGFGWVPYGGENVAIQATDMYQNGNKVGIM